MAQSAGTKTAATEAQIIDEFDFGSEEMTKAEVMEKGGVTTPKAVENWMKDGLPFHKFRRRDANGKIRVTTVFMRQDVDDFLAARGADKATPVKPDALARTEVVAPLVAMKALFEHAGLLPQQREHFITTEQVVSEYGLCEADLKRLVDEKQLRKFAGKDGKRKWSRRQIEAL